MRRYVLGVRIALSAAFLFSNITYAVYQESHTAVVSQNTFEVTVQRLGVSSRLFLLIWIVWAGLSIERRPVVYYNGSRVDDEHTVSALEK